jgi:hypothetical protein
VKDLLFFPLATKHQGIDIFPSGVLLFNQRNLTLAQPALQLLFSCNGIVDVLEAFKVDEAVNFVLFCEAIVYSITVLFYAKEQSIRDADIELARLIGQNIDEVLVVLLHGR